jgi:hypothetical protein
MFSGKETKEVSKSYQEALCQLKKTFQDNDPIEFREVWIGGQEPMRACFVFCDGLVDSSRMF